MDELQGVVATLILREEKEEETERGEGEEEEEFIFRTPARMIIQTHTLTTPVHILVSPYLSVCLSACSFVVYCVDHSCSQKYRSIIFNIIVF